MDRIMKMKAMKAKDHKFWTSPSPKSINKIKMINLLLGMKFQDIFLRMVKYIPWTQGMYNEVMHKEPRSFSLITLKHKKCVSRPLR